MSSCFGLTGNLALNCTAATKAAGIKPKMWVLPDVDDLTGTTGWTPSTLATALATITLAATKTLYSLEGRVNRNSALDEALVGDTQNTLFNHTVNFAAFINTQADRALLDELIRLERAVIWVQDEDGTIMMYGYSRGLKCTTKTGGSGTLATDDTAHLLTFTGAQKYGPIYCNFTGGAAYLDGLLAD